MALLDNPKAAPLLGIVLAGLLGYLFYTGDGVGMIGVQGVPAKKEHVKSVMDSIGRLEAVMLTLNRQTMVQGSVDRA